MYKWTIKSYVFGVLALSFVLFGVLTLVYRKELSDYAIHKVGEFKPGSPSFASWERSPYKFKGNFYFFNWTNPEGVLRHGEKAHFVEIGPISYDVQISKSDIVWNHNNGTISFNVKRTFYENFDGLRGNENVTTLNILNVCAVTESQTWNFVMRRALSILLTTTSSDLIMTKQIDDILFHGIPDKLLTIKNSLPLKMKGPSHPKFAFFYGRNDSGSYEGRYNMDVNTKRILRWRWKSKLDAVKDDCNKLEDNNSYLDIFENLQNKYDSVSMFLPDVCRSVPLNYDQHVNIGGGLEGVKFIVGDRFLDNGTIYPENKCYCEKECIPSGMQDISRCKFDQPLFVSLPHFYLADPYYSNAIIGMQPDPTKHESFLTIQPKLGFFLQTAFRLQVNTLLQPFENFILFEKVPKLYVPLFWFEQVFEPPTELVVMLNILFSLEQILAVASGILIAVGLIFGCLLYRTRKSVKKAYFSDNKTIQLQSRPDGVK